MTAARLAELAAECEIEHFTSDSFSSIEMGVAGLNEIDLDSRSGSEGAGSEAPVTSVTSTR
jgi:hypothetical protein